MMDKKDNILVMHYENNLQIKLKRKMGNRKFLSIDHSYKFHRRIENRSFFYY